MIRKTVLRAFLASLFLVSIGLVGCSDDVDRVTTSGVEEFPGTLSTDAEWPGELTGDYEYYYFDDGVVIDEGVWDLDDLDDRYEDDNPSNKPLDRGSD